MYPDLLSNAMKMVFRGELTSSFSVINGSSSFLACIVRSPILSSGLASEKFKNKRVLQAQTFS